ncbi:MAG: hypothetical protein H0W78_07795 [Planctomycetes bacterium]|nr:hypothetical protein [Planctomycetota bacterium]
MKSPKAEAEDLMNAALPFAKQMLAAHGEFLPYGQALDKTGVFIAIGASDGREHPPSRDLIQILKVGMREGARAGKYKATAIVYDVRVTLPSSGANSDAIAVSLNHEGKYTALAFFAYRLEGENVVMGEVFAQPEENYSFGYSQ